MSPDPIKFGTDGWRAIIADTYTNTNVARVAQATADWLKKHNENPSVVLGHDCRFGGAMFADVATRVLCDNGVKVFLAKGFVSTPMVSLGIVKVTASAGVVITASHNPPSYNGYKLKAHFGGPAGPADIAEVEALLPDERALPTKTEEQFHAEGLIEYIDLEEMYMKHVEENFDLETIRKSGIKIGYDAMYGAGQNVMRRLFPEAVLLHCDDNPSFRGQAPEPIHKNLIEFSELIKNSGNINLGIANDGDADRIGVYDKAGNFVDSHRVILLLVHYLHKYKGMTGKVVTAFSVSNKINDLCKLYGLPTQTTKIGFKYICAYMADPNEDVLVGGEESGGIATKGHIPERDGIWMGLLLLEFMAKTGKSLNELLNEVYEQVGGFAYNRNDLRITNELKHSIMDNCKAGSYTGFGKYNIQRTDDIDGYRFYFSDNEWVMIRPSGTEPVLRVYAEAPTAAGVEDILSDVKGVLLN